MNFSKSIKIQRTQSIEKINDVLLKTHQYKPQLKLKTSAWIALVNNPKSIKGIGTISGTKVIKTPTTSSSAKIFPKSRKLNDKGLVKSSKILIGKRKATGEI